MPIPFPLIAEDLQLLIAKKLYFSDFASFRESSMDSNYIGSKVKTKFVQSGNSLQIKPKQMGACVHFYVNNGRKVFSVNVPSCPVRIVADDISIWVPLYESLCEALIVYILSTNSSFGQLNVTHIKCSKPLFHCLLKACKVTGVTFHEDISREYLAIRALNNLHSITLSKASEAPESALLLLRNPRQVLSNTKISNRGINRILKEWLSGQREIEYIAVRAPNTLLSDVIFRRIKYSFWKLRHSNKKVCVIKRYRDEHIFVDLSDKFVYIYLSSEDNLDKKITEHDFSLFTVFCIFLSVSVVCIAIAFSMSCSVDRINGAIN